MSEAPPATAAPYGTIGAPHGHTEIDMVVRLRAGAPIQPAGGAGAAGEGRPGALLPGVEAALRRARHGDARERDLSGSVLAAGGPEAAEQLHMLLGWLETSGQLERGIRVDGRVLARLRPVGHGQGPRTVALAPSRPVKLSRFTIIRAESGHLIAQAPRSSSEVEIAPAACCLLGALADWTAPDRIADDVAPGLPAAAVEAILPLLAAAELLAPGGPDADREGDTPAQGQWKVADLWLHARSRGPLLSATYGIYPVEARRFEPLPARAEPDGGRRFRLTVPDPDTVATTDPGLTRAIESRRSIREQDGTAPLTADQLGELLYRTTRLRDTYPLPSGLEAADRPYPSGGASHELEIYPLVTNCAGLDGGLWHYRADDHQLRRIGAASQVTQRMLANARTSCLMDADPQVLLVIAARFGRVMRKYDGLAYSLILKHVGVYMQTIYLVATAMGLAVCSVGGGDAADFATATGLDYYAQGSVGEMVVGSRPAHLG